MLYIPKWKIGISIIISLFAIFSLFENFKQDSEKKINLGLDLQGGSYLLLEIDHETYFEEKIKILKDEVRTKLRSNQINYMNLRVEKNNIKFSLRNINTDLKQTFSGLGTDIKVAQEQENVEINYSEQFIIDQKRKLLDQSVEIIRRRIDETGTKEPLIQPQGYNRIILEVPGVKSPERLKALLGKTAKISFHLLNPDKPFVDNLFYTPQGYEILTTEEERAEDTLYLVKQTPEITGELLNDAQATLIQGQSQINFKFDSLGAKKFANLTSSNVGRHLAIVLDKRVISAPVIREPIIGGQGVISGNFTAKEATDLAILLRAGSLPAPLDIIEERTVGPSLGKDSIIAGERAVAYGFLLVLISIVLIYKKFGLFANLALLMNVVLIFSILTLLGATLTLPGIAGIVLTIGMAVDTNVLIFERIREESRTDKSIYAVIDHGFNQAFKTIIDSNLTTLIAALILFNFGTGPIKGFAVTLSAGILSSMFSAIFLTKLLIFTWVKLKKPKKIII